MRKIILVALLPLLILAEAVYAQAVMESLPLFSVQPPPEAGRGAEVVLISGYSLERKDGGAGFADVKIDRPGSKVLLVLTANEKIHWRVSATPSTKITAIIMGGRGGEVSAAAPIPAYMTNLPYAYETGNIKFDRVLAKLNEWFDVKKVDVYRGSYYVPPQTVISSLDPPSAELSLEGPRAGKPKNDFSFELVGLDYKPVRWKLTGPEADELRTYRNGRVALSPHGNVVYLLKSDGLEAYDGSKEPPIVADLPAQFPPFSHPTDLAYDKKRDIVTVVSLGGKGVLYRFDAKNNRWLDSRSLDNVDIKSFAYDEVKDRYVAWTDDGEIMLFSPTGDVLFKSSVAPDLVGFGRLYDKGNERPPRLILAPKGDELALVALDGNSSVKNVWYYDLRTKQSLLTYQARNK